MSHQCTRQLRSNLDCVNLSKLIPYSLSFFYFQHGCVVRFGSARSFRFIDPMIPLRERLRQQPPPPNHVNPELNSNSNYAQYPPQPQPQQPRPAPPPQGKDNILPAVLEFREETEEAFFNAITLSLDVHAVQFKLAPTYTTYMATRFRASTHYR